jgi:ABC-type amino acid transport substrate-binding protein
MKISHVILVIAITVITSFGVSHFVPEKALSDAGQQAAFARVDKTGVLRCGYAVWYPGFTIDPNTGQFSGVSYDVMNEVGKRLNLKVEWVAEGGFGSAERDLQTSKYDLLCADVCLEARRYRAAYFSKPFIEYPQFLVTRMDDSRIADDPSVANSPDFTAVTLTNTMIDTSIKNRLPNAKRIDASELGAESDIMMAIATKKADVSIFNQVPVDRFNDKSDVKLRSLSPIMNTCHGSFLLPHGEEKLKRMIDGAIDEIIADGAMPSIYKKYLPDDQRYWRVPFSFLGPRGDR